MNLASQNDVLLALKLLHIFAAAFLVGAAAFHYFLVRPSLRLIPPAHALVLTQRLGTITTYLSLMALGLLLISGLFRLHLRGDLEVFLALDLFMESHLRALGLMTIAWFVILVLFFAMAFMLRFRFTKDSRAAAAGEGSGMTQMQASRRLDRLQLLIVIVATLAFLAGASMIDGGLF